MPTMILTLAWLWAVTFPVAPAAAPTGSSIPLVVSTTGSTPALPAWLGQVAGSESADGGWLFCESDSDEETDDQDDTGINLPIPTWPKPRSPFGLLASNPHPTIIPRSAFRSPVLRC